MLCNHTQELRCIRWHFKVPLALKFRKVVGVVRLRPKVGWVL